VFEKFNEKARRALFFARYEASKLGSRVIESEHILLGILREGEESVVELFRRFHVKPDDVRREIEGERVFVERISSTAELPLSEESKKILAYAAHEAESMLHPAVGSEHLLVGVLRVEGCLAMRVLMQHGFDVYSLREEVLSLARERDSAQQKKDLPFLTEYSRDLTALAAAGGFDPLVGREREVERIVQILSRRTKNNPILLGEPGVGKTAIVEGLAQRIVEGRVPIFLATKKVLALDLSLIVAGTKYRGQFEERLKGILKELRENKDVIVFVDEIHSLIGAGSAEGSLDAANILKPALARGEITVIGATTVAEYRKHFETDSALDRRFQPIQVEEPSAEATVDLLRSVSHLYERHHTVTIRPDALPACVRLSVRFVPDRRLPDKALDLLDEACADASLSAGWTPNSPDWSGPSNGAGLGVVDAQRVARVVSERTSIPVHTLTEAERDRIARIEPYLEARVVGQREAVEELATAVRLARSGLRDPRRPRGVFLFAGASGVGKTELARALADFLFPEGQALVKLDMSEFGDKFTGSRLLGAPPGYQGHGEEGQLTGPLRRRPYAVVLLDEFEKAHPDVQAMFLSLFDEGVVTDAEGRKVHAKEAFFVLTTNAGSQAIGRTKMGFGGDTVAARREAVMERARQHFRPELLNRLDGVVVFRELDEANLTQIVGLNLERLKQRAAESGIALTWEPAVAELCAKRNRDPAMGARPALRAIDELVAEPLGRQMLNDGERRRALHAVVRDGKVSLEEVPLAIRPNAPAPEPVKS
jgi:ATP-dependent Clp protease ATP-binding subunit ClpC